MSQDIHYSSCILVYSFKNITYLIPKYTREGVSIHFLYSTHFKSSFLFDVQTIGIDIHAPIIAGVTNVSYSTSKHSAISCAILNLYFLIQLHCSVYDLLYTHINKVQDYLLWEEVPSAHPQKYPLQLEDYSHHLFLSPRSLPQSQRVYCPLDSQNECTHL